MKNVQNIWRLSKGGRRAYLLSLIAVLLSTLFGYVIPMIQQFVIDNVIGGKPIQNFKWLLEPFANAFEGNVPLWACAVTVIILAIFQGIFSFLKGRFSAKSGENIAKNLRNTLFWNLLRVPYKYYGKANTGDIIQRCTSDIETVRLFIQTQSIEFSRVAVMVLAVLPILFSYDTKTALAATCLLPIIVIYSGMYFFKMRRLHKAVAEAEAELSTVLQENLTGTRVVKAFARQNFEMKKFEEKNSGLRDISFKQLEEVSKYWAISASFCMAQIGIVMIYGIYSTVKGTLEIGEFTAIMTYETTLVWTIRGLGRIIGEMGRALVSFSRIDELLDEKPEEVKEDGIKTEIKGEIEFKNVSFSYDDHLDVLNNISLKIPAGKTVALVGPTGSGKSSLINLLPRLYDCTSGEILIDGKPIKDYNLNHLRQNIGLVLQEPFLFSETIAENIRSGSDVEVSDEKLQGVAKAASVHEVITSFTDGYDTFVGERGVTLSGGQKQRVAIARALAKDHSILIFDDSLSAVDSETDFKIRTNLKEVCGDVTTIIISHRMSTVSDADEIYIIEDGKISAKGTHEELLKQGELYARLWEIQQEMNEV